MLLAINYVDEMLKNSRIQLWTKDDDIKEDVFEVPKADSQGHSPANYERIPILLEGGSVAAGRWFCAETSLN